jgi:restriction system protein
METRFSEVRETRSLRGVITYWVNASHDGLQKHQVLRAGNATILAQRCLVQAQNWNGQWLKQSAAALRIRQTFEKKEARRLHIEGQKESARERTIEAQQFLEVLQNTLAGKIELDPTLDWEQLKLRAPFPHDPPEKPNLRSEPVPKAAPPIPERSDYVYRIRLSVLDRLIPARRRSKLAAVESRFDADIAAWREVCAELSSSHQAEVDSHLINCRMIQGEYALAVAKWKAEKAAYCEAQSKQHAEIDALRVRYESKERGAVIEYCERVLLNSDYPTCIPREFEFDLSVETGLLLLNCRLPAPDDLPRLAEIKYVQATDALSEKFLSDAQIARLYEDVLYQITLRTIHELFQSDSVKAISAVVFNGIVTSTDKSTGKETTACILSIQVSRDIFLDINLAKVDPKACFRQLKGVGSAKLHSITPVAPIIVLQSDDPRFVPSYGVTDRLSDGYNLATMDWEDFEHLIREVFGMEFSSGGGEVKVTQASRDGGVDAVVFDPDPIRGGKIVIQAKRYAYTVGVSAVRDLYGTVLNEGASKGILVTTSEYGPDAYEFANGKPLTLLSGSHLLHLLGKHGVRAHINLSEARTLAHERFAKGLPEIRRSPKAE